MSAYRFIAFSRAKPGEEAAYHEWYDRQHLGDVLKVPGFVSGRRFAVRSPAPDGSPEFAAIFEIDSDDIGTTMAELRRRIDTPAMPISPAMDGAATRTFLIEAIDASPLG